MSATLANLAVIGATIGTVTFLLPQISKLIRTRDSTGVSATWPALGFVTNVGWFCYMISQGYWAATLAPFVTFVSYAVIMWALARNRRDLRGSALRGVLWSGLLAGTVILAGWSALGAVLGFSYGIQLTPSVWTAFRTQDPSGISPGTWWIGLAEALMWGCYGIYQTDAGIVTFFVVGSLGCSLMLIRYHGTRRLAEAPA